EALSPGGTPAKPGVVIELTGDIAVDGTIGDGLIVPEGVTIRGGRRGLQPGARISYPQDFSILRPVFIVNGADARITGLRIVGPSADTNPDLPRLNGIAVRQDSTNMPYASRTIIDHNDLSQFTNASVRVEGGPDLSGDYCLG